MLVPKRLKHANLTKSHKYAPKMEKKIAQRLGGVRVKGSGSGAEKGDVRVKNVLRVEAKCTAKKSFTVTREMVEKIERHALASGELPAIEIEFLDEKGKPAGKVAVVPTYVLDMIVAAKHDAPSKSLSVSAATAVDTRTSACSLDASSGVIASSGRAVQPDDAYDHASSSG